MRMRNFVAKFTAFMLAVSIVLSSASVVQAEDATVTETARAQMELDGELDVSWKMDDAYYEAVKEYLGWDWGNNEVAVVATKDLSFSFLINEADKKAVTRLYLTTLPPFYRDDFGKLKIVSMGGDDAPFDAMTFYNNGEYVYSDYDGAIYLDKKNTYELNPNEVYWARVSFNDDSFVDFLMVSENYQEYEGEMSSYWGDSSVGPYIKKTYGKVFSNLHFNVDTKKDSEAVENYVVDLVSGSAVVSADNFTVLQEKNQTKDVVIKSNNDVTFTFKKGTMKSVEGKDSYDFSATMNSNYSADLPTYVTKDNFIAKIDYNYSGTLPGEATIRFYVGTQYAEKVLYYSLLNEDKTYAEVQAVTVDSEGYMTVKQNHCSSYIVTSENPAKEDVVPKEVTVEKASVAYTGKAQKPAVKVLDSEGKTISADNYSVSYKNNKNVGQATVTVTLKGNYSGTLSTTFQIKPKSTKISSVTAKKKGFTLKWKKQTNQTTGYQIQYATNNKFTSAKNVYVNSNKKATKTISKLKAKKTYYARIRTYKTVKINGKNTKIYSDWSATKKVVTKK